MKLLYRTAEWHALAKLRMHCDSTLLLLEELTTEFGQLIRQFRDLTCAQFKTVELPRETAARKRRHAKQQSAASSAAPHASSTSAPPNIRMASDNVTAPAPPHTTTTIPPSQGQPPGPSPQGKKKGLNLFTIKFHFLGDYVRHIRLFGTTDSYSTQLVYDINLDLYRLCLLALFPTGRTCPSTCEAALWPHKQKECHPTNCQEIHPAASFS